jgi:hypothetical protein
MDGPKTKDVLATIVGGGTGVDLFWTGLDGIVNALNADELVKVSDCKLLVYGCVAAYLGYIAWKDERRKVTSETETTTVRKETIEHDNQSTNVSKS